MTIPAMLYPGIRAKLSFFTAFFVIIIITIISLLYLSQQYASLTESFDREIQPLRKYTEKIVLDLQSYSESLIVIEEFRLRLQSKSRELKRFKKRRVRTEKKGWFTRNILGGLNVLRKGLVDTRAIRRVHYAETYFSEYITPQQIRATEARIQAMMRDARGNEISAGEFKAMQNLANGVARQRRVVDRLKEEIQDLENPHRKSSKQGTTTKSGQQAGKDREREIRIETLRKRLQFHDARLNRLMGVLNARILKFYYQSQQEAIKELGLNMDVIRIQSFSPGDDVPNFDTKIFANVNALNSNAFTSKPEIQADWISRIESIDLKDLVRMDARPREVLVDRREYEIFFRPILTRPAVYNRARLVMEKARQEGLPENWSRLLAADTKFAGRFSELADRLRARMTRLRKRSASTPGRDPEFRALYREYAALLRERTVAFKKLNRIDDLRVQNYRALIAERQKLRKEIFDLQQKIPTRLRALQREKNRAERDRIEDEIELMQNRLKDQQRILASVQRGLQDWRSSPTIKTADAFNNLRNSALYEYAIFRLKHDANTFDEFLQSRQERNFYRLKWRALRNWVMAATSETRIAPVRTKTGPVDVLSGGILWRSRSEVEEEMWRLDSTILFGTQNLREYGIANELFLDNVVGFTRTIVDKSQGLEKIRNDMFRILYIGGAVGLAALVLAFILATYMARNIREISARATEVGKGRLNVTFDITSRDEIGRLSDSLNGMVRGLIERDKAKSALGKFVNPEIAEMAMKSELHLGGEKRECAILFSDIRSFTAISERLPPERVVAFLNHYFSRMVGCVNVTGGIVDKFIGDAIMATWGSVRVQGNHAENAVNAALLMRRALIKLNEDRGGSGRPMLRIGCGLNFGPVVAGQIGSEERLEYTVIGDAVNLASRVEALNKPFGTDILITEAMYNQVRGIYRLVKMRAIQVKGKSEPQTIYAVLGRVDDPGTPQSLSELRQLLGIKVKPAIIGKANIEEKKYKIL